MLISDLAGSQLKDKGVRLGRFLILLSLLGLGGLTPGATARAAPPQDETFISYDMWVKLPDHDICVGATSTIAVELRQHTEVMDANGDVVAELDHRDAAATIQGSVRDPDIGTLTPESVQTRWDVDYGGQGRANFSFHARKAGETTVRFKATIESSEPDNLKSITVVDCPYKVTMVAFSVVLGGDVSIWTVGRMQTRIAADNGQFNGSGSVKFNSGARAPECSIDFSLFQVPTTITGPLVQNDELTLNFKFEPTSVTNHVKCPDVGGGSASHPIDLTNLNLPEAKFPAEGGTRAFKLNYAGSDAGDSTVIITVEPIK